MGVQFPLVIRIFWKWMVTVTQPVHIKNSHRLTHLEKANYSWYVNCGTASLKLTHITFIFRMKEGIQKTYTLKGLTSSIFSKFLIQMSWNVIPGAATPPENSGDRKGKRRRPSCPRPPAPRPPPGVSAQSAPLPTALAAPSAPSGSAPAKESDGSTPRRRIRPSHAKHLHSHCLPTAPCSPDEGRTGPGPAHSGSRAVSRGLQARPTGSRRPRAPQGAGCPSLLPR